jgi:hypothetical protein
MVRERHKQSWFLQPYVLFCIANLLKQEHNLLHRWILSINHTHTHTLSLSLCISLNLVSSSTSLLSLLPRQELHSNSADGNKHESAERLLARRIERLEAITNGVGGDSSGPGGKVSLTERVRSLCAALQPMAPLHRTSLPGAVPFRHGKSHTCEWQ